MSKKYAYFEGNALVLVGFDDLNIKHAHFVGNTLVLAGVDDNTSVSVSVGCNGDDDEKNAWEVSEIELRGVKNGCE